MVESPPTHLTSMRRRAGEREAFKADLDEPETSPLIGLSGTLLLIYEPLGET